jgi:hypothetical protein
MEKELTEKYLLWHVYAGTNEDGKSYGYIEALKKRIDPKDETQQEEGVNKLCRMGYITSGFNSNGDTWKLTRKGKTQAKHYFDSYDYPWWERLIDKLFYL